MSNIKNGKGFAGFGDLLSDVSKDLDQVNKTSSQEGNAGTISSSAISSQETTVKQSQSLGEPQQTRKMEEETPQSNSPSVDLGLNWSISHSDIGKIVKWAIAACFIISILYLGTSSDQKNKASTEDLTQVSASEPDSVAVNSSNDSFEEKPPVGKDNVLNSGQIRYCLCEEIRIKEMKGIVNASSEAEVDLFNAAVTDYNSRCSEFRYRKSTFESVQAEVEQMRSSLEEEGRHRILQIR